MSAHRADECGRLHLGAMIGAINRQVAMQGEAVGRAAHAEC